MTRRGSRKTRYGSSRRCCGGLRGSRGNTSYISRTPSYTRNWVMTRNRSQSRMRLGVNGASRESARTTARRNRFTSYPWLRTLRRPTRHSTGQLGVSARSLNHMDVAITYVRIVTSWNRSLRSGGGVPHVAHTTATASHLSTSPSAPYALSLRGAARGRNTAF